MVTYPLCLVLTIYVESTAQIIVKQRIKSSIILCLHLVTELKMELHSGTLSSFRQPLEKSTVFKNASRAKLWQISQSTFYSFIDKRQLLKLSTFCLLFPRFDLIYTQLIRDCCRCRQLLYRMIEHINKLFMAVIVLSLFTYFERPDYNLPLFAFIILLWDNAYVKQKTRIWYLMAVSLFVDLVWIIYWSATWGGYKNAQAGLCNFTVFISVVIFILKLVIIILTFVKVDDCKRAVGQFGSNLKYVFKGPTPGYDQLE